MSVSTSVYLLDPMGFKDLFLDLDERTVEAAISALPSEHLDASRIRQSSLHFARNEVLAGAKPVDFAVFQAVLELACERVYLEHLECTDSRFLADVGLRELFTDTPPIAIPKSDFAPFEVGYIQSIVVAKHRWRPTRDSDIRICRRQFSEIAKSAAAEHLDIVTLTE